MPGISKESTNNYGGIARLYYALQRDITELFDFDYERSDLSISQADLDNNFHQLSHMIRTAGYDFQRKPAADGETFDNVIEAIFTKDRQEIRDHMAVTAESKLCFIFKTHNGQWYILPLCEESTTFKTGKDVKDTNAYGFAWSSLLAYHALPISIT